SPETLQGLQQHAIAVKQQNLALIKSQGEKALRDADLMSGSHDRLAKLNPDERAKAWPGEIAGLANAGVDTSQVPHQYPGEEAFKFLGPMVKGHEQQLKDLAAEAGLKKTEAETKKLEAETQFATGPLAEAKYADILSRLQAGQPVSDAEKQWA